MALVALSTNDLALAAIIVSAATAVLIAIVNATWQLAISNRSRRHELRKAREERNQERLAGAYIDLLAIALRSNLESTARFRQLPIPVREVQPDEVVERLTPVQAFGSDEVNELVSAWANTWDGLQGAIRGLETRRRASQQTQAEQEAVKELISEATSRLQAIRDQVSKELRLS